eukprot:7361374-Pyramimonas_sp.AAC.1
MARARAMMLLTTALMMMARRRRRKMTNVNFPWAIFRTFGRSGVRRGGDSAPGGTQLLCPD